MKLNYRVVHVQEVDVQKTIEEDGESVTQTRKRTVIELVPEGHDGSTIMVSARSNDSHFVEDTVIAVEFGGAE